MKCNKVHRLMGAYLYGDLEPEDMRDIRLHIQVCERCRADLESRGHVISSLSMQTPSLSDNEKEWLADSIKQKIAVSRLDSIDEPKAINWWLRPAPIVGLAALVLIGFAFGRHLGSGGNPFVSQKKTTGKAKVTITEAASESPSSRASEPSGRKDNQDQSRSKKIENMADYARRMALPAVTGPTDRNSNNDKRKSVIPDEPVSVAGQSEIKKEQEVKDATKLPKPTGLNDAQTANEQSHNNSTTP